MSLRVMIHTFLGRQILRPSHQPINTSAHTNFAQYLLNIVAVALHHFIYIWALTICLSSCSFSVSPLVFFACKTRGNGIEDMLFAGQTVIQLKIGN